MTNTITNKIKPFHVMMDSKSHLHSRNLAFIYLILHLLISLHYTYNHPLLNTTSLNLLMASHYSHLHNSILMQKALNNSLNAYQNYLVS